MTPQEAVDHTPKELHSALIRQLLGCLDLTKDLPTNQRHEEVAQTAFLIAKEIYGQARETKQLTLD